MKEMHSPLLRSWSACHGAEEADNEYFLNLAKKPKHLKPQKKGSIPGSVTNSILKFTLSSKSYFRQKNWEVKAAQRMLLVQPVASSAFWFCKCNH